MKLSASQGKHHHLMSTSKSYRSPIPQMASGSVGGIWGGGGLCKLTDTLHVAISSSCRRMVMSTWLYFLSDGINDSGRDYPDCIWAWKAAKCF